MAPKKKAKQIELPDIRINVWLRPETQDQLRVIARDETARRKDTLPPRGRITIPMIIREAMEAFVKK